MLMNKCPKCGTPQVGQLPFCEGCGNAFPPPKDKSSKAALAGFIISLVSAASMIAAGVAYKYYSDLVSSENDISLYISGVFICITLVGFLSGLIVSIIGIKKSKKPHMKGLGFSITGIIISSLTGLICIAFGLLILIAIGLASALANGFEKYYDSNYFGGEENTYENMLIRTNKNEDKSAIFRWYWDGDPENLVIDIPDYDPEGIKITSLGGRTGSSLPQLFEIELDDSLNDYFETTEYKQSPGRGLVWNYYSDLTRIGIEPGTTVYFKEIVFTVKVGRYIEEMYFPSDPFFFAIMNDDGSISIYRYYYRFECDSRNELYQSNDGVLSYKYGSSDYIQQGTPSGMDEVIIVGEG